ncbi:hypothetical protein H0H92_011623 [Tricholoma furcatifolium]|nr:hypothetical protein H0H92_011623 [Tricholoma furcatifolium]
MERLGIKFPGMQFFEAHDPAELQLQLPDRIITRSVSLKHLALQGHGMNWELSPASEGLKSFELVSHIPANFQLSMAQLLRFLSQIPRLENLSLDIHPDISRSNVERIHMGYLKDLSISCGRIATIDCLFDYLTFSRDTTISTHFDDIPSPEPIITSLETLTRRLDGLTSGPVLKLTFEPRSTLVKCWKPKQMELDANGPPTIIIGLEELGRRGAAVVLKTLRLDQLVHLDVAHSTFFDDMSFWTFLGNLPRLAELKVHGYADTIITVLSSNLKVRAQETVPKRTQAALQPLFPALTNLTLAGWINSMFTAALLECFKLRKKANLPLRRLVIETECSNVDVYLPALRKVIDEVEVRDL